MANNGSLHAALQASQKTLEEIYTNSPLVGLDTEANRKELATGLKDLSIILGGGEIQYITLKEVPAASVAGEESGPVFLDRVLTNVFLESSLTVENIDKVKDYFVDTLGYQEDPLVKEAELDGWKFLADLKNNTIVLMAKMLAKIVNVFRLDTAKYIYLLKRVLLENTFESALTLAGEWIPIYADLKHTWVYGNLFLHMMENMGIEDPQKAKDALLAKADKLAREGKTIEAGPANLIEWLRNYGDEFIAEYTSVESTDAPAEEEVEEAQPQTEPELIVQPKPAAGNRQSTADRLAAIRESVVVEGEDDDNSYVAPTIQIQPVTNTRAFEVPSVNITINEPKSSSSSSGGSGGSGKSSDGWETAGEIIGGILVVGAIGALGYWAYNKFFGDSSSDIELLDFSNGVDIL